MENDKMALITCPELGCSNQVSSTAKFCPKCGYDFEGMRKRNADAEAQRKAEREAQYKASKRQEWISKGSCLNCGNSGKILKYGGINSDKNKKLYYYVCSKCGSLGESFSEYY